MTSGSGSSGPYEDENPFNGALNLINQAVGMLRGDNRVTSKQQGEGSSSSEIQHLPSGNTCFTSSEGSALEKTDGTLQTFSWFHETISLSSGYIVTRSSTISSKYFVRLKALSSRQFTTTGSRSF